MSALHVIHEDEQLLVVNKHGGVPVQPDRTGDRSLLDAVRDAYPDAQLVHRIDRPVSGAVLFARDARYLDPLHALFREHRVEKIYWAIVTGMVERDTEWVHHMVEDARSRKARMVGADEAGAHEVRCDMKVLARGDRYTLIELRPAQGRFHQLRAQCAAAGHPIKGDVKYGARRGEKDRSIALHARSLAFVHPFIGKAMNMSAPAPATPLWVALLSGVPADR